MREPSNTLDDLRCMSVAASRRGDRQLRNGSKPFSTTKPLPPCAPLYWRAWTGSKIDGLASHGTVAMFDTFDAQLNAWQATLKADRAEILARLEKLEANPGLPQREQPCAPLDAAAILNRLLADPNLGDAVRQQVFQIRNERR